MTKTTLSAVVRSMLTVRTGRIGLVMMLRLGVDLGIIPLVCMVLASMIHGHGLCRRGKRLLAYHHRCGGAGVKRKP